MAIINLHVLFNLLAGRLSEADLVVVHAEDEVDLSAVEAGVRK
jgi:hypothetical protein